MSNLPAPKVSSIRELNGISATGQTTKSYIVSFSVGQQGPFTLTIPGDQFTAPIIQAAMQKFADEINKLPMGA